MANNLLVLQHCADKRRRPSRPYWTGAHTHTRTQTHTHTHTHAQTYMHTRTHADIRAHMRTQRHMQTHACTCACTHTHTRRLTATAQLHALGPSHCADELHKHCNSFPSPLLWLVGVCTHVPKSYDRSHKEASSYRRLVTCRLISPHCRWSRKSQQEQPSSPRESRGHWKSRSCLIWAQPVEGAGTRAWGARRGQQAHSRAGSRAPVRPRAPPAGPLALGRGCRASSLHVAQVKPGGAHHLPPLDPQVNYISVSKHKTNMFTAPCTVGTVEIKSI